jgi:hypothetical protein
MAKKRVIAFRGRTNAGDRYIEAGVPIAVIESDIPWDSIISAISVGNVIEIESSDSMEYPVAADDPPAGVSPEVPAGGQPADEPETDAAEEVQPESPQTETCLKECGLTHSLADRLAANGITTAEQLGEFVAGNGELAELEGVGPARAKRIMTWWNSRQS